MKKIFVLISFTLFQSCTQQRETPALSPEQQELVHQEILRTESYCCGLNKALQIEWGSSFSDSGEDIYNIYVVCLQNRQLRIAIFKDGLFIRLEEDSNATSTIDSIPVFMRKAPRRWKEPWDYGQVKSVSSDKTKMFDVNETYNARTEMFTGHVQIINLNGDTLKCDTMLWRNNDKKMVINGSAAIHTKHHRTNVRGIIIDAVRGRFDIREIISVHSFSTEDTN